MSWHHKPYSTDYISPGGLSSYTAPPFGLGFHGALYIRESPDYEGTLFFTDPFTTILNGVTYNSWTCKPLSCGSGTMEWVRYRSPDWEMSLHQTDGDNITHSVRLPDDVMYPTLYRCESPDGFVMLRTTSFFNDYPGIYFLPIAALTSAPALGDGNLPTMELKQLIVTLEDIQNCSGATLVGDIYYFMEPTGSDYPGGEGPAVLFSSYDLGTDTYTEGSEMPALWYRGLTYVSETLESPTSLFITSTPFGIGDGLTRLYSYDPVGNTLSLLLKGQYLFSHTSYYGLSVRTTAVGSFPLTLDISPAQLVLFEDSVGEVSFLSLSDNSSPDPAPKYVWVQCFDVDYDLISVTADFSTDAGMNWSAATTNPAYPLTDLPSNPTGTECSTVNWRSDLDVITRPADALFRLTLTAPDDSVGLTFQIAYSFEGEGPTPPPTPPADPTAEDKISAASLESPLEIAEALCSSGVTVGSEATLVLSGSGLLVKDSYGDTRISAVMLKSAKVTQVFDSSRFIISLSDGVEYLNIKATLSVPGVYDVYLLDRDGSRIALFPAAIEVV